MRISDWSSDVCSSDLFRPRRSHSDGTAAAPFDDGAPQTFWRTSKMSLLEASPVYKPFRYPWAYDAWLMQQRLHWLPEEVALADDVKRSEERSVGKGCVSTCRSRGTAYH